MKINILRFLLEHVRWLKYLYIHLPYPYDGSTGPSASFGGRLAQGQAHTKREGALSPLIMVVEGGFNRFN